MTFAQGSTRKEPAMSKAEIAHEEDAVAQADHDMSAWQCIKENPKIAMWTIYANLGATMVGYENLALSVCLAMPAFQMTFASDVDGVLIIPAYWQSAWNSMYNAMGLFGSLAAGYLQDWFGRRAVFLAAIICSSAGIAISVVSETPAQFLGAKIVAGFAIGLILSVTQTYVSEIAPLPMRGIALSVNTVMLNIGLLLGVSATFSRVSILDKSAFRVVFAAGWTLPGLLLLGLPFLPESPYWLVMKNKHEKALSALKRLSPPHEKVEARLARIQHTVDTERLLAAENISLSECFCGTNWRRTRIILICMYMPQVVGTGLSSNAPYFLNQTGLDSNTVIMLTQIGISVGVVSTLANIFMMMKLRHRTLMFAGVILTIVMFLIMGIVGVMERTSTNLTIIGVAVQFTSISYGPAVGASMAVAGEVSASRLRAKSVGIGVGFYAVAGTLWQIVLPYLFNQDEANLGGNIGWIFFAMGVLYLVILYFDVPGTKGRTFDELDVMFAQRVPSRRFEKFVLAPSDSLH